MLFTVIGTLLHELGHIAVAKYFGYDTYLYYGSMSSKGNNNFTEEELCVWENFIEINSEVLENNSKEENLKLIEKEHKPLLEKFELQNKSFFWIRIGGPAQTILTGFLGLLILYLRKSVHKVGFKFLDWLGVFLSLFVLREAFNTITGLLDILFFGNKSFGGDEFIISRYLGYNQWLVPVITMILALIIAFYIVFKVIPLRYRLTFIIAGLVGGLLGYYLWFSHIGPKYFPVIEI
ncbi:hypothetical protein DNG35_00330 [Mesonia sp. K7]|nr:hypothetical protein DNG35_00330 [Mesonia sp. K7]